MNTSSSSQKYIFHVRGMHCASCVTLTEHELKDVAGVEKVRANLGRRAVEVEGAFSDSAPAAVAQELSKYLEPHGYSLTVEKGEHTVRWSDFKIAIPFALGFIAFFILLQKLGIVNMIGGSNDVTYGTAFVIGIVASLSTCMAVVGGLVLSMSANFAKEGDKIRPQALFHVGRLIAFFVLGGLIGMLGSAFTLGQNGTFILGLIIALVLFVLGINLLDIFPWAKRLQPTLPKFLSSRVHDLKKANHSLTPIAVGVLTFFLPCGFTQSMQIYTLSTGEFLKGGLTMFVFALGTLPVLALLSFTSMGIKNKTHSGIFFKTAGLVVIFFALFNLLSSLAAKGIIPPLFTI